MFCTLDSFSLLWLLNTINCPKPPKSPQFFLKGKPLIVFSMIFSLFCRYPEILTIHCTFLILVDINIHCNIKDIHVCMYIFFFSFQTWQTAVWNLMRMVMAFPDTLSTTIRKDKRTMGLITKSLENGKILLKWMNDKWCGLQKLPSQQQVSSTYPNVKNLRGARISKAFTIWFTTLWDFQYWVMGG